MIDRDYQVSESADGYAAIGTGDDVALGALYATASMGMVLEHRLEVALAASAHHIKDVRGPFLTDWIGKE